LGIVDFTSMSAKMLDKDSDCAGRKMKGPLSFPNGPVAYATWNQTCPRLPDRLPPYSHSSGSLSSVSISLIRLGATPVIAALSASEYARDVLSVNEMGKWAPVAGGLAEQDLFGSHSVLPLPAARRIGSMWRVDAGELSWVLYHACQIVLA